jgi:putative transposase
MLIAGVFRPRAPACVHRRGATFAMIHAHLISKAMGNTFISLNYHFVFSTKNRERWISHDIEERVWNFLGGIARENGMKPMLVGGMPDHVHISVGLPTTLSVAKALQLIKGGSSKWMKDTFPEMRGFGWLDGYGAFSVSKSNLAALAAYIEGQREHHKRMTFKEEFVSLLVRHGIEYEEKYLWD